jgi:exosortase
VSSAIQCNQSSSSLGWALLVAALWIQLFAACIYGWRFGEYYDYGWYIPPFFAMFMWRVRGIFSTRIAAPIPRALTVLALLTLTGILFCLRVVERVDPRWTLPIWIQAFLVVGVTLLATYRSGGRKACLRVLPILAFACTAIPLPTALETLLISNLTSGVIVASSKLLQLLGMQIHTLGDKLSFMNEVVAVTEGCSGIRSAQSFLMISLFFGELMKLRSTQRLLLVAIGIAVAWVLNVIRATSLAAIHFKQGREAFDQAHDNASVLAFVVGSILLLAFSAWIGRDKQGRAVRKRVERREA